MNPNTSDVYGDPRLAQARDAYASASQAATGSEAAGYKLPDQLKAALTQKFASADNPLVQNKESALKNYLNETSAGQLAVTHSSAGGTAPVILNPLQQADIIQKRHSNVLAPLATANDLLNMQQGGMKDVIDSTSRAQQSQTAQLQGNAKIAGESYKSLLDELSQKADRAFQQKQLDETIRHNQASEGISAASAGSRYDRLTPAQQFKQQQAIAPFQDALMSIQEAKDALGNSGSGYDSGFGLYGIRSLLPQGFGGYSQKQNDTIATLSKANTNLFKIAGTQFTAGEKKLLPGLVLDPTKSTLSNMSTLSQYQRSFNNSLANISGGTPAEVDGLRKLYKGNEDKVSEFLMNMNQ